MVVFRLLGVSKSANRFNHVVLWIGLARVNYVVNCIHAAKMRMVRRARLRRYPHLPAIGITIEMLVTEISSKQTKLPKMARNIFSDVSQRPRGTHNHLGIFIRTFLDFSRFIAFISGLPFSRRRRSPLHHPTSLVLAFGLKIKHALLLQLFKRRFPKMKMENFAFLWQEIIFNVQPLHGFKMAANDGVRNQPGDCRRLIATLLNVMQRLQPKLQVLFALFIPLRTPRVEVPAVIVDRKSTRLNSSHG